MIDKSGSFGTTLRAFRLGFYYSPKREGYVRMRWLDEDKKFVEVEICPTEHIKNIKETYDDRARKHICLSDSPGWPSIPILNEIPLPEKFSKYERLIFNEKGELTKLVQ